MILRWFATICLLLAGCGGNAPDTPLPDQTGGGLLPAGKYVGTVNMPTTTLQSHWQYNPITQSGQVVPQVVATVVPSPFAGGDLDLDGKGTYSLTNWNASTKFGVYILATEAKTVAFKSGPFANCTGKLEQTDTSTRLTVTIPSPDAKPESLEVYFSQERSKCNESHP